MEAPAQVRSSDGRSSDARSRSPRTQPRRPPPPNILSGIRSLGDIQQCHDDAYKLIELGLTADEEGKADDARAFYQSGLQTVTKVLDINCEQLNASEDDKNQAKSIQQKLNKTKLQIEYRLQALRASEIAMPSAPEAMNVEEPPSYEESTRSAQNSEFVELGDSIMREDSISDNSLTANAAEIFCIPDGVQIFYITPEGYVSAPSYPTSLKIFKFIEQKQGASNSARPAAFLQVGDWLYPLQPGSSPALQSNYGAYLFPDCNSQTPGSSVGLMVPDTLAQADRELFEEFLNSLTVLQQQGEIPTAPSEETVEATGEVRPAEVGEGASSTSTKISKGLLVAAEYISWGVGKGAEKAGQLMKHGSTKLRERLHPEEKPTHVDPKVQKGIHYARKGTHVAVQVSSFIVTKLGEATMKLAKEAAPHLRKQGEKILPASLKSSSDGKSKFDGVIEVAASGLKGFGTVYMSLEMAAKALGKNLACETVEIVSHKYGTEAGKATENALYATGNLGMTAYNANHLGVKAIAKRAAKDTGKAVLEDFADRRKQAPQKPPPPGSGASPYPGSGPPESDK